MADVAPGIVDGPFLCRAHPVLDLGEGLLDRIEVWRIGWQIPQSRTGSADHLADSGRLVRAEIVHHDDVAGFECRHEKLLDIGSEAFAVDRAVEDTRCGEPITAQRAEEGERAPVAVRGKAPEAFAPRPPAPKRRHVGLDPGFVDKDQPLRIETGLKGSPALAPPRYIGAGLLKGEQRFF